MALWLKANSDTILFPQDIEELEFLFGIRDPGKEVKRINLILLYGRFYVHKQKIFCDG